MPFEVLGHAALVDAEREPLGERRLPDAGLADEDRVVLAAARQDVDRAIELGTAPDQRIELALRRPLRQVRREGAERIRRHAFAVVAAHDRRRAPPSPSILKALVSELRLAVADVAEQVETRDALPRSSVIECASGSLKIATIRSPISTSSFSALFV